MIYDLILVLISKGYSGINQVCLEMAQGRCPFSTLAPKLTSLNNLWCFAIAIPRTDNATAACCVIIQSTFPVCVSHPNDLVNKVPQNLDVTFDKQTSLAIRDAAKYKLLAANLTWVCFNLPSAVKHLVCASEHLTKYMHPRVLELHVATTGTLVQ